MSEIQAGSESDLYSRAGDRHPATLHLIRYFAWSHLPQHLAEISQPVAELAVQTVIAIPDGPELTAGLRKLLEAKDCLVRAALAKEE